jgi:3-oxoacyl-[acyl-carrier-protein] synthase III
MINAQVIEHCHAFMDTMSDVCETANFGFNSFRQTEDLSSLCLKASRSCTNRADDTPVSLTIVAGSTPDFQINGLHAYASLNDGRSKSTDPFVMVAGLIVALLILCVLLCVNAR